VQADLAPIVIWAPEGQFLFTNTVLADGLNIIGQTNQVVTGMVYYFNAPGQIT